MDLWQMAFTLDLMGFGGRSRIRTCDLHRVNLPALGFSTTYNTAGTAKVRGSRARKRELWVGQWVGQTDWPSRRMYLWTIDL